MFDSEQELVNTFTLQSRSFLETLLDKSISRYFLIHEFDSNYGVADVVLGTYRPYLSKRRTRQAINWNWLTPLSSLRQHTNLEIEDFCKTYGYSRGSGLRRLKEYQDAGFIIRRDATNFKVIREYEPITEFVVSIEAKLRDWRKALIQAQRYKRFSDLLFVLLDGKKQESALENIMRFKNSNIGLISLHDNDLEIHFVPERNARKLSEYYLRINEAAYRCFNEAK